MTSDATFLEFLQTGQYLPAIGLALITFVALARFGLSYLSSWFSTKLGGYAVGFGSAFLLYLGAAFRDGKAPSFPVIAAALGAGWAASGGFEMVRDVLEYLKSKKPPVTPAVLLVALIAFPSHAGCGQQARIGRVTGDVIDCMTPSAKDAIGQFGPALAAVLRNATSDAGSVDWAPVKAVAAPLKSPAARCALAAVISEALRPKPVDPDAPQSEPALVNGVLLLQGFDTLRTEIYGGARFELESGTL